MYDKERFCLFQPDLAKRIVLYAAGQMQTPLYQNRIFVEYSSVQEDYDIILCVPQYCNSVPQLIEDYYYLDTKV